MTKLLNTVKAVEMEGFAIALVELANGKFCVAYGVGSKPVKSSYFTDYTAASYVFDKKIKEHNTKVFYN